MTEQSKCPEGHCYLGTLSPGDYGFFNGNEVFLLESAFPNYIKDNQRQDDVWIFSFCPKCGKQVDRKKVAEKLGVNLEDLNGN